MNRTLICFNKIRREILQSHPKYGHLRRPVPTFIGFILFCFFVLLIYLFWDRVSCSLGWPGTLCGWKEIFNFPSSCPYLPNAEYMMRVYHHLFGFNTRKARPFLIRHLLLNSVTPIITKTTDVQRCLLTELYYIKIIFGGWSNVSLVRSIPCSSKGPELGSLHTNQGPHNIL